MNLLNIISFAVLFAPTIWELLNDAHGDTNKTTDVYYRVTIFIFVAAAAWFIGGRNFFAALNLSLAIFFAFFDYAINYILIRNGILEPPRGVKYHWFTFAGKSGVVDNISFWKNLNPYVKLLIRVTYFVTSIILYFTI